MDFINVSNRLPVTLGRTIKKSSGGLVTAMESLDADFSLKWIGWPGTVSEKMKNKAAKSEELREKYGYIPIFLTQKQVIGFYQNYSNSSLWPVLHYMPLLMKYKESWWDIYKEVNTVFCEETVKHAAERSIVWIHDYHLMLLPEMIKKSRPDLKVGFFLHTPFPSYEVFRALPNREELIKGLLGSDLLGFHTFGYLRHFRSTVLRLLGFESEMNFINHENGITYTDVFPIGINSEKFLQELTSAQFKKKQQHLAGVYKGKRIVLSVERLDYTKGIRRRLEAIDEFLRTNEDNNSIVFIFVSVPTRGEVKEYRLFIEEVESMVGKINGTRATVENTPVHFLHRSVDFHELCALYNIADVALVTPLMDGMNLVAKEFIACQTENPGVLVLSEFAGAADELTHSEIVNPYNLTQMISVIRSAFKQPLDFRRKNMDRMKAHVVRYDNKFWAKRFLGALMNVEKDNKQIEPKERNFTAVAKKLEGKQKIAMFLDYDGTLREFEDIPSAASPTDEIIRLLHKLENLSPIDLFIISGRSRKDLEEWLSSFHCTLIAEHGLVYKDEDSSTWETVSEIFDSSWKDDIISLFQRYEDMMPGSFTEEKSSSVVWHYRRCDPEFGKIMANQLLAELYEMPSNMPVEVHQGHKIIEVSSVHINKGAAVKYFVHRENYDIILCAGDDYTDESMFALDLQNQINIKVGKGMTKAEWRVNDPKRFHRLLEEIVDRFEK